MSVREVVLALFLAASSVAITVGASIASPALAWVVGGVLLAVWALIVLSDDGSDG